MISHFGKSAASVVVLAIALLIGACDSASVDQDSAITTETGSSELASTLVADVGLTADQHQQVLQFIGSDGKAWREPGFAWRLAAQLQSTLTEEQKQRLFEGAMTSPHRGRLGQSGSGSDGFERQRQRWIARRGDRSGQFRPRAGMRGLADILTEDQKAQAEQIRNSYREQIEALRDQVSSGELTREEARTQVRELRGEMRADIDALLTDEQRSQLEALRQTRMEQREARHEASREVRNEVLGLDADVAASLDAILDEFRDAVQALREELRADDADRDQMHVAVQALKETRDAEVAALLDEAGFEVFRIHGSLRHRLRAHQMGGAADGGIGQRGLGNSPSGPFGSRG